jgi:outer membrane protein assembly factor BamB
MMKRLETLMLTVGAFWCADVLAGDWPIYRGANHDGISTETGWSETFGGEGPPVVWEAEVGIGFASFTVSEGRVYTTGHADDADTVFCLDAKSGKEVWKHSYPADLGDKYYEGGTSATPTVAGGRVYHLSRWGDVFCYEAATGKVVWTKQVQKEAGVKIPDWGFSGSPYVTGDLVVLNVGEAGLALATGTGAIVWKSGDEVAAGYSTAYPLKSGEQDLLVLAAADKYNAVDAKTGKVAWSVPWKTRYGVNAADPIRSGQHLFISSGYSRGCALLKLGSNSPEVVWENKNLKNQFNSSVLIDGHLYGIDDDENRKASLRCLEWATGEVKWEEKSVGFGAVTAADGKLIVQTEKGELIVAKATPAGFEEISRGQVLSGRCWTTPVLANGLLHVRNSAGQVKCLNLSGAAK